MKMMQGEFCLACSKRSDADEHLDEVGAGDREERHPGLAGDGPREQRLAGARRAVEQDALRDAGAERLELLGVLEELLDLMQLLHGLVDARDVAEGDLRGVDRHPLRPRLAEAHHARAATLHLVHQEEPEPEEEDEREDVGEDREEARAADALDLGVDVVGPEHVDHGGLGVVRVADRVLAVVLLGDLEGLGLLLDRDVLDRLRLTLDRGDELVPGGRVSGLRRTDQPLREKGEHDHDQDRERRASEEPSHPCLFFGMRKGIGCPGALKSAYQGALSPREACGGGEKRHSSCPGSAY
jgi:hypothetical protein